ncbi:MAG TPA: molybdopterin-dependent oxidoreductase, partial [Candidatus Aquilonibacter sp.]|nr:molybdopterin-dependent oxidoreductase [Candidatus Aquilonibacter sp.]
LNSRDIKLNRKATQFVQVPEGHEPSAIRWMGTEQGQLDSGLVEKLTQLKAALDAEPEVAIVFGAEISGAAVAELVTFGSRLQGKVRYMALGDYANSRGAADMGLLPDRLPGYAPLSDSSERARFEKLWGGAISPEPGFAAPTIVEAALNGSLKVLYVVGANPLKTFAASAPDRLAGLDLLVVQDMFLTETAQRADVVLPAASTYEKDGSLTNTAGEVQLTHRAIDPQGPRSDFDLLRILSHQLAMLGLGTPIRLRTPEAALEEIRQNVPGYNLAQPGLLAGGAELAAASCRNVEPAYDVPPGTVFSSHDYLFTSGTLGRYCSRLTSTSEAKEKPWSSSPSTQSWWYR